MNVRLIISGLLCVALLTAMPAPAPAAEAPREECSTTVVRAWFTDRAQVEAFAARNEPWEVHHEKGYMVVGGDAETLRFLTDLGFRIEVDEERTAEICTPRQKSPGQTEGIPDFGCYRTVEETYQTAQNIVANHPDLASWIDVGDSWEKLTPGGNAGYDMMVLRLTNANVTGTPPTGFTGKPRLFVTSAIHAREYTTAELTTRFAEYLISNYGIDADATWLLDEHEIHLLLQTNPDGRKHAETGILWRKNSNENYCSPTSNDRGADLNRNFEFQWDCCGGSSGFECDETYRGPSMASEPEVQTVQNYARSIFPDQRDPDLGAAAPADATGIYLDIHSHSELVLWPWGFDNTAAGNGTALQTLGRKLAFFNSYDPRQAIGLYPADGTTIDFAYGDLGIAAYLFELGTWFFQDCASFESTILPDNLGSLIHAAKVVRTPYLTPAGPEIIGISTSTLIVAPGDEVALEATADDTRFNNSNGAEPSQTVAAAEFYIDTPPWQSGATAIAMSAFDGSFDSSVEDVEGTIHTTGLAEGRHIIFLRSRDADANWGPVSAEFLWVLDPANAAHLVGSVASATSGSPLGATVSTGVFTTLTNPASGGYDLELPESVYDVTASALGFGSQTLTGVVAPPGIATTVNFELQPYETHYSDNVEDGINGWTAEGQWAITNEASASPDHSWTDSPGLQYGNDWDNSLISPVIDLVGTAGVTLEFSHIYELEDGYDHGHVETSSDGGATWATAAGFTGSQIANWERVELALPGLDHAAHARIRFRIETDWAYTDDGWHIDDIVIRGFDETPPGQIFADGFENGGTTGWSGVGP